MTEFVLIEVTGNLKDGSPRLKATPLPAAKTDQEALADLKVAATRNRGKAVFLGQLIAKAELPVAEVTITEL